MSDTIRYIIEALRNKPTSPGVYREQGRPVRRVGGGNPVAAANSDVNYVKYQKQQSAMGESPVSYEEWLRK